MPAINLNEAKANLSRLVDAAVAGEEIIIAKAGKPVVRLAPVEAQTPRQPGIARGRLTEAFFEPLPERELAAWEA
jgi:prevent-host-death family protein